MLMIRSDDWITAANAWVTEKVTRYHARRMYIPAGETPRPLWSDWSIYPPDVVWNLDLYQLDDVNGKFARYFRDELPALFVHEPLYDIQADLGILGLGNNGHVAFHEPGILPDFRFGEVTLQDETADRLKVPRGSQGRTFGLGAFMKTDALLLLVIGEEKRRVWRECLATDDRPASALRHHPDLTVLMDR